MFDYHYGDGVKKKNLPHDSAKNKMLDPSSVQYHEMWPFSSILTYLNEKIKPTQLNNRLPASLMSPSTLSRNQKDLSLKNLQHLCSRSFQQRVHGIDMVFKYKPTSHTGSRVINYRKNPGCLSLSFSFSLIFFVRKDLCVLDSSALIWRRWIQIQFFLRFLTPFPYTKD